MLINNRCAVMINIYIFLICIWVISARAEFEEKNKNYDEIDPFVDMLLNGEYDIAGMEPNESIDKNNNEEGVEGVPVLYPDGVWKCGNCTHVDKMKLLYSETYDYDTNYDDYVEELNMEIQIGLSLKNMRCITMEAEEEIDVRLVTGACTGEQATMGIVGAAHCVISVYG